MKDAEIIRAKMIFLGLVYFQSYGGFNIDDVVKKFEKEFKFLELKPFDEHIAGYAKMDNPTIALFAQLGHELNSFEFDSNIKYYRGVSLHELIHKFLIKRDENGQIIGTGLLKMVDRSPEFNEYLRTSKINRTMELISQITMKLFHAGSYINEFGRGANEGYTEWFRKNILKNDENISYEKLTHIFDIIQKRLEIKNGNAIEIMKKFKDGDYNYIFNTLNMSKEVGILFTRMLDFMYVRENEKEMSKKYLEAKKLQEELKRDGKNEELLSTTENFCMNFENNIRKLKTFKNCKSEQDFLDELNKFVIDCDENETEQLETIKTIIERADSRQNRKLELTDIKDLQKDITSSIFGNTNINDSKNLYKKISIKIKNSFKLTPDKKMINQEDEENIPIKMKIKNKIKKPSFVSSESKRFMGRKNDRDIIDIINRKIKDIAYNMDFFVQDTFSKIKTHKKDLKPMTVLAILATLGISSGFFVKHCIDRNVQESSKIEEVLDKDTKQNKQLGKEENIISEKLKNKHETEKVIQKQKESLIRNYLKNGISLKKGDKVYKTSYKVENDIAKMSYDYDNLYCDLVRVIKDNDIIQDGEIENIDKLYKIGVEKDADVMLRTGVFNEDGTITYIAWCNLNEMIEKLQKTTKEQKNNNKKLSQGKYNEFDR